MQLRGGDNVRSVAAAHSQLALTWRKGLHGVVIVGVLRAICLLPMIKIEKTMANLLQRSLMRDASVRRLHRSPLGQVINPDDEPTLQPPTKSRRTMHWLPR